MRICRLREWKQKAITQMSFMQEKLRVAIPITEFNLLKKEVELAKQQTRQTQNDNFRLAEKYSEI